MVTDYARQAARGAELRTKDTGDSSRQYQRACQLASESGDSYATIRQAVIRELSSELTEGGAKGMATKLARVALWLRAGNSWPAGWGLTKVYNAASGTGQVTCPNCSHQFTPTTKP